MAKFDLKGLVNSKNSGDNEVILLSSAIPFIVSQLEVEGRRERTIHEYKKWFVHFVKLNELEYVHEINTIAVYQWLNSMDVQNSTKLIRLKCVKAVLNRFYNLGWLPNKFWESIKISVEKEIKPSAKASDVLMMLSAMDLDNWFELRDAVAILLMFRTGLRLQTLSKLELKHIDLYTFRLNLTADIMKNRKPLTLPFPTDLVPLIQELVNQNKTILKADKDKDGHQFLFITEHGKPIQSSFNNNVIQKRITKYARRVKVKNVNPHALRRGFATNLLKQGASVPLISKALGHSDLSVTTQYLYLEEEETVSKLKEYL